MNKSFRLLRSVMCASFLAVSSTGWADSKALTGENIIAFPELNIPFVSSYRIVSSGTVTDGGCSFPLDSTASPDVLLPGQRWITIQLSYNPKTCQELLEKGIVDLNVNPELKKLLNLSSANTSEINRETKSMGSPSAVAAASSTTTKTGKVRVWFTDRKNPTIVTVNQYASFDGFLLSGNQIDGTFTTTMPECVPQTFDASKTEELGLLGWVRDSATTLGLSFGCNFAAATLSAVHANKSAYEPFFDCKNILRISYAPMRLRINVASANKLEGAVNVTGDFNRCGEFAQRFQDGPY